jgi:hypothetical protein
LGVVSGIPEQQGNAWVVRNVDHFLAACIGVKNQLMLNGVHSPQNDRSHLWAPGTCRAKAHHAPRVLFVHGGAHQSFPDFFGMVHASFRAM